MDELDQYWWMGFLDGCGDREREFLHTDIQGTITIEELIQKVNETYWNEE